MQNKLYTIHFSHRLMTDSQTVPEWWPWNPELVNFVNSIKFLKKIKLPEKFELPDKRVFKFMKKRKSFLPPANPYL